MNILTFTTLFPNAAKPHHGIFTETTLRYLLDTGEIKSTVVAPIPWFPLQHTRLEKYSMFAQAPTEETRIGVRVLHPRYLLLPKVGMTVAPFLLAQAAKATIGRLMDEGNDFDVIDAHYFYPDGVAAVMLGKYFNKPVIISALGSDINLISQYALPRRMIRWAAHHAASMITVCEALKTKMVELGIDGSKIVPLRNGVDLDLFHPVDRSTARARLGIDGFTLLSVGNLVLHKGHDLAIAALPHLPDVRLLIAGSGPDKEVLEALAIQHGVADRVKFLGPLPQAELRHYYGACDALVLASSREGWANVLLESMACGTPVVASNVGGTPEVIRSPAAGILMRSTTPQGVIDAVHTLRNHYPDHAATRSYAEGFSWAETTRGHIRLFEQALQRNITCPIT